MSMRRKVYDLQFDQIRQLVKEEVDLPITMQDFEQALSKCNRSVSKETVDKFEKWMHKYGSA
jgi:katanin p60 ATPase-containing subunit A1